MEMVDTYAHADDPIYFGLSPEQAQQPIDDAPIRQFVWKVHSRCNLGCGGCYVFELADQTWRALDREMSPKTVRAAAWRMGEHAAQYDSEEYNFESLQVVLHGAEPTLIGANGIDAISNTIRHYMPPHIQLRLGMQTNGLLLDWPMLDVLRRNQIKTSISLDGLRAVNDKFRAYPDGRGSFDDTVAKIQFVRQECPEIYAGLIYTLHDPLDPENDPIKTFELMDSLCKYFDIILPYYNWTNRPPGHLENPQATPYADWLITLFDHWIKQPEDAAKIRLFESIMRVILGRQSLVDQVGITRPNTAVIDVDGKIRLDDTLMSTYEGATTTGLNVYANKISGIRVHPLMRARKLGKAALSPTCQKCHIVNLCGAGSPATRWDSKTGFNNPSAYCLDLQKLIGHIRGRILELVRDKNQHASP